MNTLPEHIENVDQSSNDETALFEAILEPHRSLSPRGFLILMSAIALVSFAAGTAFVLMGAWPVFGFFGLDVALIYVAFKVNFYSARMSETVRLTENELTVVRTRPDGQVMTWRFQPYWLQVGMDDPPQAQSKLTLSSHGKSLVIGEFLTPHERLDLADTLRHELHKLRQPPSQPAV